MCFFFKMKTSKKFNTLCIKLEKELSKKKINKKEILKIINNFLKIINYRIKNNYDELIRDHEFMDIYNIYNKNIINIHDLYDFHDLYDLYELYNYLNELYLDFYIFV